MDKRFSLVLVHTEGWQDLADFEKIRDAVEAIASDIEVFIVSNLSRASVSRKKAARVPSLIFSPIKLLDFRPDRGRIYQGVAMSKLEELARLVAHGLPVPPYEALTPDTRLTTEVYGDWVVLKPAHELASWGDGIELSRTCGAVYRSLDEYPDGHVARKGGVFVQSYIDCGHAMTCRVLTLFGEPILTYVRTAKSPLDLESLTEPYQQRSFMPVDTDMDITKTEDQDIFDLARSAYEAMPEIALQACDILRDKSGKLYVLEVNPGGGTWMFSSKFAPAYREALNVDDLASEFNAFNKCAEILVERTRAEAM